MFHYDYFRDHDEYIEFAAGDVIFAEGDASNKTLYAVKEGSVEITVNGIPVETVEAGNFFGEMSLIDAAPRSATAIATIDSKIVFVDKYHFLYLTHETPTFALHVMHVMANRIRRMNEKLAE